MVRAEQPGKAGFSHGSFSGFFPTSGDLDTHTAYQSPTSELAPQLSGPLPWQRSRVPPTRLRLSGLTSEN